MPRPRPVQQSSGTSVTGISPRGLGIKRKKMEKQDVPNARDEIKKLQKALKTKNENPGSADDLIAKEPRASQQEFNEGSVIKPVRNPDEQTADNFATQANRKKLKR